MTPVDPAAVLELPSKIRRQRTTARLGSFVVRGAVPVLAGLIGALILLNLFGSITYQGGDISLEFKAQVASGGATRILIPPFGEVTAATHRTPVRFDLTVQRLGLDFARRAFSAEDSDLAMFLDLPAALPAEARRILILFALKLCLLTAGGGGLAAYIAGIRRRRLADAWKGAAAGLLLVGALLAVTYRSFEPAAFRNPQYTGMLKATPHFVAAYKRNVEGFGDVATQLRTIASNLETLSQRADSVRQLTGLQSDLVVLHVSDIHSSQEGVALVKELTTMFQVSLVIDTGDLTDLGTPIEAELISELDSLGIPYLLASGNHESPEFKEQLGSAANIMLLDNDQVVEVKGLRIMGVADPGSLTSSTKALDQREAEAAAGRIGDSMARMEEKPDVVAVHNHRVARAIPPGLVQAVVYGHNHRLEVRQEQGTLYLNAGTTGGAGIRGFQSKNGVPYSAALLYFSLDGEDNEGRSRARLLGVDTMEVRASEGRLTFRRVLVEGAAEAAT